MVTAARLDYYPFRRELLTSRQPRVGCPDPYRDRTIPLWL